MGNTIGKNFRVTSFGESHGPGVGAVVDGVPAGLRLRLEDIQADLDRRKPGMSPYASPRKEPDQAEILSGLTGDGLTNGAPIAILVRNLAHRGTDYQDIAKKFRPGHADWTYFVKYGIPPQPGGGRSSGRETVARVAAGAVARALLAPLGVSVRAGTDAIGTVKASITDYAYSETDPLRFLDPQFSPLAQLEVEKAMERGDSVGGTVRLIATGVPAGLGDPVFGKLEALLGKAFFSIGAVRAVELGDGIRLSGLLGSAANDPIGPDGPLGNLHGGILGGISTGLAITARLFVRPTPSISISQRTVDLDLRAAEIETHGRHDPCIAPRLCPVAEAMALISLADCHLEGAHRL
ncbi:MAG: chorismate synthase [Deltaproteobacteria bacterium]|jgi:chorismate synthase|nr:chorismate synthase [Deltaproteobacteria bacterium]